MTLKQQKINGLQMSEIFLSFFNKKINEIGSLKVKIKNINILICLIRLSEDLRVRLGGKGRVGRDGTGRYVTGPDRTGPVLIFKHIFKVLNF